MTTIENEHNKTILVDKKFTDEGVKIEDCEGCRIEKCDFSYDENDKTMLTLKNCVNCVVSNCEFHDKKKEGLFIKITGEKSQGNIIEHCTFRDHKFPGDNGGEPIRIGNSDLSGCWFNTTVRHCVFRNLTGDPETVSIKSCGNVLENNEHEDCKSNFTIRHGGFNKIRNNKFKGSGGIRVFGDGNEITGNYHQDNNSDKFPALALWKGSVDRDPNFVSDGKPSSKQANDTHDAYARAINNLIEGNTYENCEEVCVRWGKNTKDSQTRIPKNNKFRNNTLIADAGKDSEFLKFDDADVEDNKFEDNQMYGKNAKPGDMPQEAIKKLSAKPEIKIPQAGK